MVKLIPDTYEGRNLEELLECIIRGSGLCSIATVTSNAQPHIHTAYYARRDLARLIFASNINATHSLNVETNPRCAITIYPSGQKWDDWKKGVQGFGTIAKLRASEVEACQLTYSKEYPEYEEWLSQAGEDAERLRLALYEIVLDKVQILSEEEFGEENLVTVQVSTQQSSGSRLIARSERKSKAVFLTT